MKAEFEQNLEKYAELIVKVGLNIQPGQKLVIGPPYLFLGTELETAPLVRLIAKEAYQAGARLVDVMWNDEPLEIIRLKNAPRDSFDEYPTWRAEAAIEAAKAGDALLLLISPNDDLFADQDQELLGKTYGIGRRCMKPFMDLRGIRAMNFSMAAAPIKGWADKIFPDLPPENRLNQFWELVFEFCRVDQPDPLAAWKDHNTELGARKVFLNSRQYTGLHMTASGTDLSVGLPDGHIWIAGSDFTQSGIEYYANFPTEEIFTLPHKDKVDGVVAQTKPGPSVEGLVLTFSKGKVVNATAKNGEDIVHRVLEVDDGARQLGEVALVPQSTPISQSGRLFYNLLFDENASCHLAMGNAYRFCIEGGEEMSVEEFMDAGGNNSQVHIDFMIGSEEMDIDGIKDDGSTEPVMRGGEWAFEI